MEQTTFRARMILAESMIREATGFTFDGYKKILEHLMGVYQVVPLCALPKEDIPYLVLRHDVDFSLKAALKMAHLEQELGIRSTYFVLCSCVSYSMRERGDSEILKQISELGHEIGLHYSPSEYRSRAGDVKNTFRREIQLLEHLIGKRIVSIARHGPWDRDPFAAVKGYLNANNPRLRGDLFVHDSCRVWNTFDGLVTLFTDPPKRVQLLVHPDNWTDEKTSTETLFNSFFDSQKEEHQTLRKEPAKYWFEDSAVLEYHRKVARIAKIPWQLGEEHSKPRPQKSEFRNFRAIITWYLINTQLGWKVSQIAGKMRNMKN